MLRLDASKTAVVAVDTMDGEAMHRFALDLMSRTCGWPLTNAEIVRAFGA